MATSNFERTITASKAIGDIMRGYSLTPPNPIVGSTDNNANQFLRICIEEGQKLLDRFVWQMLSREFTINTVVGQTNYSLPADFNNFVPDAEWNRTTRLPAFGSLKQYEWQMLKARKLAGITFTMLFRIDNGSVVFYDVPSTSQQLVFPYIARSWILASDGVTYRDNIQADDDQILFDPQLFKEAVRLRWRIEKGFDTTAQQRIFDDALAAAKSKDAPGRTLSLGRQAGFPYLSIVNVPDSGYGPPT